MKKTLAILLALLAAASITLASCSNNKKTPVDDADNDPDYDYQDDTDESESNTNPGGDTTNPGGTQGGTDNPITGGYVDRSGEVYAGVDLNLRTSPSASGNNNIAKTVPFGTKLICKATNGTWDKVTLEGGTDEYFVLTAWLASGNANFSFTDCEDVDITLSTTTANKVIFFETPFESDNNSLYFENAACASGLTAADLSGLSENETYKLTKVATNANWVKVTFVGKITISANNTFTAKADAPATFYIKAKAFTRGDIIDSTFDGGSTGGNTGAHG